MVYDEQAYADNVLAMAPKNKFRGFWARIEKDIGSEVTMPEGVVMSCTDVPMNDDGTYLTFSPGGQKDVAIITLQADGRTLEVMCETPNSPYRVFDPSTEKVIR